MSQQTVHILYIPGLGDGYDRLRSIALRRWKTKNVRASLIPMRWNDRDETTEQKHRRIQQAIRNSTADKVVLVGESAGGSMVVTEVLRPGTNVPKAITIAGKNVRADRVSPKIYLKNPAFRGSMAAADAAVDNMSTNDGAKFTIFYSKLDPVVWLVDTKLPGAKLRTLPTSGHVFSIFMVLFIFKNRVMKEAIQD